MIKIKDKKQKEDLTKWNLGMDICGDEILYTKYDDKIVRLSTFRKFLVMEIGNSKEDLIFMRTFDKLFVDDIKLDTNENMKKFHDNAISFDEGNLKKHELKNNVNGAFIIDFKHIILSNSDSDIQIRLEKNKEVEIYTKETIYYVNSIGVLSDDRGFEEFQSDFEILLSD